MLKRVAKSTLDTSYGVFDEYLYMDGEKQAIALVVGDIKNRDHVPCRVHSHCISGHIFNGVECDCAEQMTFAQKYIQNKQCGVIIWLEQEGRGNGHLAKLLSNPFKEKGLSQSEAYLKAGYPPDAREYSYAKIILDDLRVKSINLITDSNEKLKRVRGSGIDVYKKLQTQEPNA